MLAKVINMDLKNRDVQAQKYRFGCYIWQEV